MFTFLKNRRTTPAQIIILGFMALILAGTLLLMLPAASRGPGGASFLDALFTATSATCVTGLIVQDTVQYWTFFGQFVILLLIQIGGMGIVTIAIAITIFAGKKISLKQRWVMQESISAPQVGGIVRMTGFILRASFLMEGIGAVLLALRFCPQMGFFRGLWYAVFHSISAFCNAGFDLMGRETPFSSLTGYMADPLVNGVIAMLIILGGIGFLTWQDVRTYRWHLKSYRLQSKLILTTTAVLLLLPAVFLYFWEFSQPQWAHLTQGQRLLASLFQAVTPRTAGFNTVDMSQYTQPSQLMTVLLMLIGGSPGSTAGGFKTTTLAVFFLASVAVFRRRGIQCFGRRIQPETLQSAAAIFLLYLVLFLTGGIFICCVDQVPLMESLFESASAIGTVGLSLGVTPGLSIASRLVLVFLMYFGRVGGLTLIYALLTGNAPPSQLPQERITVG